MMSPAMIRQMSDEAARKAAWEKRKPYVFWDEAEVDNPPDRAIPFIGHYCPKGWAPLYDAEGDAVEVMIDTSGFGSPSEPALTMNETKAWIKRHMKAGGASTSIGFALTCVGQFQAHLAAFVRDGKARRAKAKKS